jgi:undecaprenyl phosphate-alpha-L-ara4FN deformylase
VRSGEDASVALRIDVDTYRGTKRGVPALRRMLAARGIRASIFFCVGPDNMGRHALRLLRPAFLTKMLRTRAASLYGWDILLRGTLGPGPRIAERLGDRMRAWDDEGHEIGLHAWDHYLWQTRIEEMDADGVARLLEPGVEALERVLGRPPTCSAAPAWKCTDAVLEAKSRFPFRYNSDCRGEALFRPVVGGRPLAQPQIPVSLPTYDELVGRRGIDDTNYNETLLARVTAGRCNVLTIHAEVEGIARTGLFEDFLDRAAARGIHFHPLGCLAEGGAVERLGRIGRRSIPGREGWLACEEPA